jgi:Sulfite exporter TauE/SafE
MIVGAVSAAYVGTALVHRVSEHLLERIILVFLVVIGTALIVEAFLLRDVPALLPDSQLVRLVAAVIFGLGIGLMSSLLGVAGGELIIPTLVFAFGAGIKTAGTASLLISLPTVAVGVLRHRRLLHGPHRPYPDSRTDGVGVSSRGGDWGPLRRSSPGCGAQARAWCDLDRLSGAHLLPLRRSSENSTSTHSGK